MEGPSVFQVIKSVLAAVIGIQSEENRKQDFTQGSFLPYIIAGIVFTVVFVASIAFVVSLIL